MDQSELEQRIENGRQVGARLTLIIGDVTYYETAAIQKYGGKYFVSLSRIAEENMASEAFDIEEDLAFPTLKDAVLYLEDRSKISFDSMGPLKGQKLFDPRYLTLRSSP